MQHCPFLFFSLKGVFTMAAKEFTAEELAAIRDYNNRRNREWWAKQSADERRARRAQYALNAIRRQENQQQT